MPDSHIQPRPRGSGQRSWTQGVRSTTEGEIFKGTDGACADPDTQNFPCHGGGQGHSQFKTSSFPVHNAAFFGTFLGSKKVPYPPSPPVPLPTSP